MVKHVAKIYWRIHHPTPPLIQAEWLAAQKDERTIAGLEEGDEDGVSFS